MFNFGAEYISQDGYFEIAGYPLNKFFWCKKGLFSINCKQCFLSGRRIKSETEEVSKRGLSSRDVDILQIETPNIVTEVTMEKIQSVADHYMLDLLLIADKQDDVDTTKNYQIIYDTTFIEPDNRINKIGLTLSTASKQRLIGECGKNSNKKLIHYLERSPLLKITGDNMNIFIKPSCQSEETSNFDLHLFASNAISCRAATPNLNTSAPKDVRPLNSDIVKLTDTEKDQIRNSCIVLAEEINLKLKKYQIAAWYVEGVLVKCVIVEVVRRLLDSAPEDNWNLCQMSAFSNTETIRNEIKSSRDVDILQIETPNIVTLVTMKKIQYVADHYMLDLLLIADKQDDVDTTQNYQFIYDTTFIEPNNRINKIGLTLSTASKQRLIGECGKNSNQKLIDYLERSPLLKITGDNMDIFIKPSCQSAETSNFDLHLFASNAISCRAATPNLNTSAPKDVRPLNSDIVKLTDTEKDQIRNSCIVLVGSNKIQLIDSTG
ncbi:unnamed protein product [Mytilus edulis]|uniref:Uncharacterized protein n=1 Tax=Mytilus edulis TaxID=6550 RepID=A0A8S3QWD9_MYTED|nr:unnamed protein product [Mytilus edulis]